MANLLLNFYSSSSRSIAAPETPMKLPPASHVIASLNPDLHISAPNLHPLTQSYTLDPQIFTASSQFPATTATTLSPPPLNYGERCRRRATKQQLNLRSATGSSRFPAITAATLSPPPQNYGERCCRRATKQQLNLQSALHSPDFSDGPTPSFMIPLLPCFAVAEISEHITNKVSEHCIKSLQSKTKY